MRGILDGHVVLDRSIAAMGRFPAIDIPMSLSRLSDVAFDEKRQKLVREARRLISTYEQADEMRRLGGYVPGADAYVQRIFGPRNALVLDRVERLPERLPQLYAALTR